MGEIGNKAMGKTKKTVGRATGDRGLDRVARKAGQAKRRRVRPATRSRGSGSKTRLGDRRRRTTTRTASTEARY